MNNNIVKLAKQIAQKTFRDIRDNIFDQHGNLVDSNIIYTAAQVEKMEIETIAEENRISYKELSKAVIEARRRNVELEKSFLY